MNYRDHREYFERRDRIARQMSPAEFGNIQPSSADVEAVARAEAQVNTRLANSSVTKCEAAMDKRLAVRVQNITNRTLARAHYSEDSELISLPDGQRKTQYYPFTFHFQAI